MVGGGVTEEAIVQDRHASHAADPTVGRSRFSRRLFLGAGAGVAAGATLGLAGPAFADTGKVPGETPFGPVVVANPGGRASYARAVRLTAGRPAGMSRTLLATFQGGSGPGFPLYRSDDDGRTWHRQGSVADADEATGLSLQPFLYELPRAFAGLPKGALLFACNWLDSFTSTNIQLYASTDGGLTWRFLSTICYYSDQRDPHFGQKLAHQTSTDLHTWGPVVDDATGTTYPERPGMTSVARLKRGLWIMTYEFGAPDDPDNPDQNNYTYHVHYRIAKDPESFRFSRDTPLLDQNGYAPNGAPVVSWTDAGGPNGTIIVTDNDNQDFFVNRDLGNAGKWTRLSSPMPAGYSRFTIPLDGLWSPQRRGLVFVITGAQYGKSAPVEAGIISVGGCENESAGRMM
jgi:hypothetical protein